MTDPVRLIERDEIVQWIRRAGVRGYRYRSNLAPTWALILVGLAGLGAAIALAVRTALSLSIHKIAFAFLGVFTLGCFAFVAHWTMFAARNYLAVDDDAILVGRGARAHLVPKSRISRHTLRLDRMLDRRGYSSGLPIEIGDFRRTIHLIGPLVNLANVQQFLAEILTLVADAEDEPAVEAAMGPETDVVP